MFHKGGGNISSPEAGREEERQKGWELLAYLGRLQGKDMRTIFLRILVFPVKKDTRLKFQMTYLYEYQSHPG